MSLVADFLTFDVLPPVTYGSCICCVDKSGGQARAVSIYYNFSKQMQSDSLCYKAMTRGPSNGNALAPARAKNIRDAL